MSITKFTCVHLYSLDSSTVRRKKSRQALQLNCKNEKRIFENWFLYHSSPKFFPSALFPQTQHIPLEIYFPISKSVFIFHINCSVSGVLLTREWRAVIPQAEYLIILEKNMSIAKCFRLNYIPLTYIKIIIWYQLNFRGNNLFI